MVFVELPLFTHFVEFDDEAMRALQNVLIENPDAGDLIQGTKGLRKLRVAMQGRGKRGGARVIYYHWVAQDQCLLLLAYPKNVMDDLSPAQAKMLANAVEKEVNHGR